MVLTPCSATTLVGLVLDFYAVLMARASGTYTRTENPKSKGFQDEDSEYRGLTLPPHITGGSKPLNTDEGPSSFPSTPGLGGSDGDPESRSLEPTDIVDGEDREMTFLIPSTTYSRTNERGSKLPEEQIGRYNN